MKKSLLAVAVAAALPVAAFAQSNVTLYGIVDLGVGMKDTDGPGTSNATVVDSGYQSTSRFGVRGSEDLGGGLRATFNFEAGMDNDTGTIDSDTGGAGGAMFQRRSVVGLAGGFGEIRLGRDYTTGFSAAGATDVMGYGLFGNWLNYTAGAGGITTRASNAIWYTSPAFGNTKCMAMPMPTECNALSGGLTVTAFYSTGERNTSPKDGGNGMGAAVVYRGGPLIAQVHYQELNDAAGDAKKEMGAGAGWNFGAFRVTMNYGQTETPANVETQGLSLGAGIRLGAGELLGQVIKLERDSAGDPKATVWGIAYVHPLSKRTNLYATYGQTSNNSAGAFGNLASDNSVGAGAAGADPRAFAVGVRHMF